jgi:exopolysaccharide production protein ExoQ
MSSQLALVVCIAFVLFLLLVERRASRGVSAALWIPTLWMLYTPSKSLSMWFGRSGNIESGSLVDQLFLMSLCGAGIVVLTRRRFDWSRALRRHGWLLALLAYTFVSTFWSDITLIALKRWTREVIVVIMALVIMSEANPRQALVSLLRRSAYILIPFSLLLIKFYPALGRDYGRWSGIQMWIGVSVQKNSLGRLCLVSAFFLLWGLYTRWKEPAAARGRFNGWTDFMVLLIALFLLKGADNAYSATSVGAFGMGIATFLGLLWLRKLKLKLPQTALLALVIFLTGFEAATPFLGGSNVASLTSSVGRDDTLTGRTWIWASLVPAVQRQPLLGAGFGSFWTTERRILYQIPHGHNGYLDILLETGAVGLALSTVWLLSCARKLHAALAVDYDSASLAICLLLMAVICNFTESVLTSMTEQMTALVALASFVVPYKPIRASNRLKPRTAPARNAETSIGATAGWHAHETWPEIQTE